MLPKVIKTHRPLQPAEARRQAEANKVPWVPVLSSTGQPLMPCHPARARELVKKGRATKSYLKGIFHIRLTQRTTGATQPVAIGVDPGSKMNGYSVKSPDHTFINIQQPAKDSKAVQKAIVLRAIMRRGRRIRHTPCRPPKFNKRGKKNWIPPSTFSRWQRIYNTVAMLNRLYPIQHVIVEDVKASLKKAKRRWNSSFSLVMTGKNWLYRHLQLLGLELQLAEGYVTAELRQTAGLTKNPKKLHYSFFTHAVDAWVLANSVTGGHLYPDMIQLTKLFKLDYCRRQFYKLKILRGGILHRWGGTILPNGICKGTIVKYRHPNSKGNSHLALVTGSRKIRNIICYSLSTISDGSRYTQEAKLDYMESLYKSNWLWQFPCSYKGYSSRRAYQRDITKAPNMVAKCYQ